MSALPSKADVLRRLDQCPRRRSRRDLAAKQRRSAELGLADYFVSLYPKPTQANYHHERTQHVGTGDFHNCNNWPGS